MDYSERILIPVSADERQRLRRAAAEKGVSMSALVRAGIALVTGGPPRECREPLRAETNGKAGADVGA
jgi:hypothetical protein